MALYLEAPKGQLGAFRPNHILLAAAREKLSRFLQNRKLCRDLRKQSSECWQLQGQCEVCHGALLTGEAPSQLVLLSSLKEAAADLTPLLRRLHAPECPSVRELHLELEEVSQLLDVSKDQYDEILSVVQRHTDETVNWLSNMAAEFSWVGQTLSNSSMDLDRIFVITKVTRKKR